MIRMTKAIWPVMLLALMTACHSGGSYHKSSMPDPATYNAHFGDMDTDQDDQVTREEFQAYFPEADMKVFEAIDLDKDNRLNHDEWHQFKEAHGLKHIE